MKKLITSIIILCSNLYCQIEIGIEGGTNISNMSVSSNLLKIYEENSSTTGILLGGFIEFNIKKASLQLGARYVQKGIIGENPVLKNNLRLNYVEIPFLVNLKPFDDAFQPVLSAGIYFALLTSFEQKQEFRTGEIYVNNSNPVYENTDMGLLLRCGINLKISKSLTPFISLSYSFGLNNVHENTVTVSASNRTIYIHGGFKIRI